MIALDPTQTYQYWTPLAEQRPIESRPMLIGRYLTCRQVRQVEDVRDMAIAETGGTKMRELLDRGLAMLVCGWRNVPAELGEFAPEKLDDVLSVQEKWDAIHGMPLRMINAENDLKKSISRPVSAGDGPASGAVAESATMSPAQPNPSGLTEFPATNAAATGA